MNLEETQYVHSPLTVGSIFQLPFKKTSKTTVCCLYFPCFAFFWMYSSQSFILTTPLKQLSSRSPVNIHIMESSGQFSMFILFDLSTAFHTADHFSLTRTFSSLDLCGISLLNPTSLTFPCWTSLLVPSHLSSLHTLGSTKD